MAVNQHLSSQQSKSDQSAFKVGFSDHEGHDSYTSTPKKHQRASRRADLNMLSLVTALIAVCLSMTIALITHKGPVAQSIDNAVAPVPDTPTTSTIEVSPADVTLPATPDKRFMNGLEVEPAPPASTDPFVHRGVHK